MPPAADLPGLLEAFFTKRLIAQRQVSPHTLAAYRDTFRLLLAFAAHHYQRAPAQLNLRDLDADLIGAFLLDLEKTRGNTVHTRNLRRASLRAFFQYAALERPDQAAQIQRVLAIPAKRTTRPLIEFLTRAEADAVLAVVDRKTWRGQRDYALLLLLLQTGLRLAEATGLRPQDLSLGLSLRALPGQGPQVARHAPAAPDSPRAPDVVPARPVAYRRLCVPQRAGRPAQPRCRSASRRQVRPAGPGALPGAAPAAAHPAPVAPHRRHGHAPRRRRPRSHRPLARS